MKSGINERIKLYDKKRIDKISKVDMLSLNLNRMINNSIENDIGKIEEEKRNRRIDTYTSMGILGASVLAGGLLYKQATKEMGTMEKIEAYSNKYKNTIEIGKQSLGTIGNIAKAGLTLYNPALGFALSSIM